MFRRDKWWHREIEKIRREHAAREHELIATICHLSGRPQPATTAPVDTTDEPEQQQHDFTLPDYL